MHRASIQHAWKMRFLLSRQSRTTTNRPVTMDMIRKDARKRPDAATLTTMTQALKDFMGERGFHGAGGARTARQHADMGRESGTGHRGLRRKHRGSLAGREALRRARRSRHPLRHRHLLRRPYQCTVWRRLDRYQPDERRAGSSCRGSRLCGAAGCHAQGAQ